MAGILLILACLVQVVCAQKAQVLSPDTERLMYDSEEYNHALQPLSKIAVGRSTIALESHAWVKARPTVLGTNGSDVDWVTVSFRRTSPNASDWIAVFSPADFNSTACPEGLTIYDFPKLCTAPIKYKYATDSTRYLKRGHGLLSFRLINQREDFVFALFTGDVYNPVLVGISNKVAFQHPKAPLYPRLAIGNTWNEMSVTWTSGYGIDDAMPIVQWGPEWQDDQFISPAGTLTYGRDDMCGPPAKTVGWRSPGFTHTAFLKELWPNTKYSYKIGHKLPNGSFIWGQKQHFKATPYPGQDTLQQIIVVGDTGKAEKDGSNEYENYQPGSLNTTDRIAEDLDNIDIVFHVGDLSYSNGYISQWDQYNEMYQQITARVPVMVASGNHERDYPGTGSFYVNPDSGGECGIPAQTNYFVPGKDSSKFWYTVDYGLFHFCVINTELDWREGSRQYEFIENCLASVDRQRQPWLIFIGHRVLGYSSSASYGTEGSFDEPMGREALQKLWQKYRVDIAFWGHIHSYERSYPTLENVVVSNEKSLYSGTFNATIHVVIGGGGSHLSEYSSLSTAWSAYKDVDFGFGKLSASNHSSLLFEYKKSRDGQVYDQFWIIRHPVDVLGCDSINYFCPEKTLAN